jgi:uncharacterized protein (DUF924 family)
MTPQQIVKFWEDAGAARWFTKDAAFDGALKIRFGETAAAARGGAFQNWAETPEGALGLVLLLDQVPRNIYRGSPLAFTSDARARDVARLAVNRGYLHAMPAPRAMWFCMPFEHSELIDDQHRCVALFQTMGLNEMVQWAKVHFDIIAKFGRFPHRNKVLGRISTPAELDFLAAGGFSG